MGEPQLVLSLVNPTAMQRDGVKGYWYSAGLSAHELERLAKAEDPKAAGDTLLHDRRDGCVVFVDRNLSRVLAWKGLMSIHEVFYAQTPGGGWLVTDHFRNAAAAMPMSERTMSDGALLQHYVGAAVYGRETYVKGVERLSNGDRLELDFESNEARRFIFSRHAPTVTDEPIERHLGRLDAALEEVVGPLSGAPGVAAAFSGGVDSTLLLSYLGDGGEVVNVVPGSSEFDAETKYAAEAAKLLGREVESIELREEDYLERLESNIETLAMPIESYVTPDLAAMYLHPSSVFLVGDGADSVFGSGRGIRRVASTLSGRAGRAALGVLGHVPGQVGRRAVQIDGYAALFAEPPESPHGYAGTTLEYHGDQSATVAIFGRPATTDLNRRLLQDVSDRVDIETPEEDRFLRHIELAQWRWTFADLAMTGNHAAHALGKSQVQPYSSWRVISEHLKVPARLRYYKGLSGKWMLKELLKRRVPEYRVNKRKLATALPFERYYRSGPLSGVWEKYDIPDVIPSEMHDGIRSEPSPLAWKALTHAIWQDRIVGNPELEPHPAAVEASWPLTSGS